MQPTIGAARPLLLFRLCPAKTKQHPEANPRAGCCCICDLSKSALSLILWHMPRATTLCRSFEIAMCCMLKKTAKLPRAIGFQMPITLQHSHYIGNRTYRRDIVNRKRASFRLIGKAPFERTPRFPREKIAARNPSRLIPEAEKSGFAKHLPGPRACGSPEKKCLQLF